MSWAQAILLARGLSRGWGGICSTALTGAPFSQVPPQAPRGLHCSAATHNPDSSLVPRPPEPPRRPVKALAVHEELFRPALDGARNKANFVRAVQNFAEYNVHKRGHVDFIYLALRKMREYGVERDLSVYNLLLDVFPKEVFRPRNIFHSIFLHYPRQQECGIAVCNLGMVFLFLEQSVAPPFSVTQPRSCRRWQRQDFHTGGLQGSLPMSISRISGFDQSVSPARRPGGRPGSPTAGPGTRLARGPTSRRSDCPILGRVQPLEPPPGPLAPPPRALAAQSWYGTHLQAF